MNKKWLPYLLLALMALAIILIKQFRGDSLISQEKTNSRGFDRQAELEYTKHAQCRMECREISRSEVEEIMQNGKINYKKSSVKARPCPTYALEGRTSEDQKLRIVYAQCDQKTRVVTVIDLDREWECHCPGDKMGAIGSGSTSSPVKNQYP